MLKKEVVKLINEQINKEFYSSYLYLDMSNYFDSKNLNGFASWFNVQAQEERDHALLFNSYLRANNETIVFTTISGPAKGYPDFRAPLTDALEHERFVTASIYAIYEEASNQKDFKTMQFLNWFVTEQGEEEKNTEDLIERYDLFGNDAKSLYLLDAELATRVYAPPTLVV